MKKALLYGLSAAMLLSLTACGTAQANQPDEPDPPPTPTPSAVQTEPPQEIPDVEPLPAVQELTGKELESIFEDGYKSGQLCKDLGIDEEGLILLEVGEVASLANVRTDIVLPDDYEAQYRAWRAEFHPDAPAEIQLFTDCSETVYATGQVNIRSSYSTDSEKLGSLSGGQSITRIGNAIADTEAEGWSKVQLSDGTVAYMVSSYLSTTKPTTQTRPSGGNAQQQTGGGTTVQDNSGVGTFDFDAHTVDPNTIQSATDAGYQPTKPEDIIYGD